MAGAGLLTALGQTAFSQRFWFSFKTLILTQVPQYAQQVHK